MKYEEKKLIYQKVIDGEQVFSTFDVLRILAIKRGRLVEWMRGGFVPSGIQVAWGERSKTVFGIFDLYTIALFKQLIELGICREEACTYSQHPEWRGVIRGKQEFMIITRSGGKNQIIYATGITSLEKFNEYHAIRVISLKKMTNVVNLNS